MKHIVIIILSLLCFCNPVVFAVQTRDDDDSIEVIIIDDNGSSMGGPIVHAPALIPIQSVCYPSFNTIYVNYLYSLGSVSIEIKNETTGTCSQTVINAIQGVQAYLFSGARGHWTITFTLSNGRRFIGEFDVN